jgi:hypothetical protein
MLCAGINIQAQSKHDANWVFGYKCGIDFKDTSNVTQYLTNADNFTNAASISDSNGNLLLYIRHKSGISNPYFDDLQVIDANSQSLGTLNGYIGGNSHVIILPQNNKYYIFYIGKFADFNTCTMPAWQCTNLYFAIVERNLQGHFLITKKDIAISSDTMSVALTATKHANGKDWWVIAHKQSGLTPFLCNNVFYKYLLTNDSIIGPSKQNIGNLKCGDGDYAGQLRFSKQGNYIASVLPASSIVQTFKFDRCSGILYDYEVIDSSNHYPNLCEFSLDEKLLYVISAHSFTDSNIIVQYNLSNHNRHYVLNASPIFDTTCHRMGLISLAPNNKMYIAAARCGSSNFYKPSFYNTYLSVINFPDSIGSACDFQPFSFPLIDSCLSLYSLPKMPNYNLGALSIYEASAGKDTVLCVDSTVNQKVVVLGTAPVNGVQYQWYPNYNLSSDTVAQPLAYPDSTTFYVVTLTDTSIKNSCQSRQDTVWVRVENCLSVAEKHLQKENKYYLYPNPTNEGKGAIIELPHGTSGYIELWSMEGKQAGRHEIKGGKNQINLKGLGNGLYYYRVWIDNSINNTQKLILIN